MPPGTWGPDPRLANRGAGPPYPRASIAKAAIVLSIFGLFCCLTGPIGLVMGAVDLRAIDRGLTDPAKRGTARAAVILGSVSSVLLFGSLLLWILFGASATMSGTTN